MLRPFPLALLPTLVVLAGCAAPDRPTEPSGHEAAAVARTRTTEVIPLDAPLINSCYGGGVGESIRLTGSLILTTRTLDTPAGRFSQVIQVRSQGVHGIGLTSGARYQVHERQHVISRLAPDGGQSIMFVFAIRIVGAGPVEDERLTSRFRLVIAPDGTSEFRFDEVKHTCR